MSLLAVDIGSSSCKAVVFATSGKVLATHSSADYCPDFSRPGFAEMNPEVFWNAVCYCCRSATKALTDPVRALCLSSHGETFVPVDASQRPVWNAILNQDGRAISESKWLDETIGRDKLFQITGHFAHPMYPISKILWIRKNLPEVFADSKSFITLIGYLLHKMGLPAYADYSLASRFVAFDIHKRTWSEEILSTLDIKVNCLPETVPAGTIAGELTEEAAERIGLPSGTPVVLGGHDQPVGALGLGAIGSGRVADSIGTYECLTAASDDPAINAAAMDASLNTYCHVVPEKFVTLAYFPSGIMVKWFHDLLYAHGEITAAGLRSEAEEYVELESHAPAGPTGLCVLPHLIGTCNPEFDPRARGMVYGLTPSTNRSQVHKGILEGLACELSLLTELLAGAVGTFSDIYASGRGTRSALGLGLRAALTKCNLHIMQQQEAVCLGSAILAGVAVGEYASIPEAIGALVKESGMVTPDATVAASYEEQVKQYRALRSALVHSA